MRGGRGRAARGVKHYTNRLDATRARPPSAAAKLRPRPAAASMAEEKAKPPPLDLERIKQLVRDVRNVRSAQRCVALQ